MVVGVAQVLQSKRRKDNFSDSKMPAKPCRHFDMRKIKH
jgi:hypothetical protein